MPINGQKLPYLGQTSYFLEGSTFGTNISGNPQGTWLTLVFRSGMTQNGPKIPILDQKCQFLAKVGLFKTQNPNFFGEEIEAPGTWRPPICAQFYPLESSQYLFLFSFPS